MAESKRKPISKKLRYEVYKRDSFTCQYCGRSAPDVILEIDHIKPIAEGGTNDIINLITSCRDCNRGKGKTPLDDKTVLEKQKKQLDELEERRQQLAMMVEWKEELLKMDDDFLESLNSYYEKFTGFTLTDSGKLKVKKLIKRFSHKEVQDALDISLSTYFSGSQISAKEVIDKLGGICHNRRTQCEIRISKESMDKVWDSIELVRLTYHKNLTPNRFLEVLIDYEHNRLEDEL